MATSSASTSVDSAPVETGVAASAQTCCATCRTVFEVAAELLASTDTRVRCGECFAIFDAAANLVKDGSSSPADLGASAAATSAGGKAEGGATRADTAVGSATPSGGDDGLADSSDNNTQLDVTYSDFDLFSEDAELPEIAYFDQTRDTPEFDFDSVALENDETFSETLFVHDVTVDAGTLTGRSAVPDTALLHDETPHEPLVFRYRDPEPDPDDSANKAPEAGHAAIPILMDEREQSRPAQHLPAEASTLLASVGTPEATAESAPVSSLPSSADGTPESVVEMDVLDIDPPEAKGEHSFGLLSGLALCLAFLLTGLYGWRDRDSLHNQSYTRPVYEMYCRVTGCQVPSRVSLRDLRLVRRNLYSHPEIDDSLALDVTFRNEAEFDQRYPVLVLLFSNSSGRLMARHTFLPEEYLSAWQATDTIAAGSQRDISLDITDPGDAASSFEVEFQETPWVGGS